VLSPVTGLARLGSQKWIAAPAWKNGQRSAMLWFYRAYVNRLGVHLIAWCDTVNNLNRYFTHQQLREFEMRVLFQMSPNDSGALLDSPVASKLGRNRAIFASEEQNRQEKFRPYGPLPAPVVEELTGRLRNRPAIG